ncbi:MAG: thiamine phosphate synthase [Holophagaceae bacterium]|nr:thiamine phosphate synthase [Holophagaceae bacterium]
MINLPPIYPITDPRRVASLSEQVRTFGEAGLPLVQFRGKPLDAKAQYVELTTSLRQAHDNGGWPMICVNDRADLAVLAAQEGFTPWGLHLGQRDLPPAEAGRLPGLEQAHIGTSTHDGSEWSGVDAACDHAGLGPFRATATKADHAAPIGLEGMEKGCAALRSRDIAPIAIGGIVHGDFDDVFGAGAECIALISELDRHNPSDLAWEAQASRWKARPPFRRGQGIALVGSSGSGKSTLASMMGPRLGLPVLDLDALIEAKTGLTIADFFQAQGEAEFRRLEAENLRSNLDQPSVMALGGGAWASPEVRDALKVAGFAVLWIAETPQACWSRIAADPTRPLAKDRDGFLRRHRVRMTDWGGLPMILPLGHPAEEIAGKVAAGLD